MEKNKNIHVTARAVIIKENHILLAYDPRKPNSHYYDLKGDVIYLPGEHVDHQESANKAVIREIKEEIGYEANILRFLGVLEHSWSFPDDEKCCHTHEINIIFEVELVDVGIDQEIKQIEKHVKLQWFPLKNLKTINFMPKDLLNLLAKWLKFSENEKFFVSIMK